MIGRGACEFGVDGGDPHHAGEESDQLEAARGDIAGARRHVRIVLEQHRIMLAQHAGARAGRRDDIIIALKRLDDLPRDRLGVIPRAGIIGGLPAANLRLRHFDDASRPFKQLHRRETHGWPENIHQASDEKADAKRPWLRCSWARHTRIPKAGKSGLRCTALRIAWALISAALNVFR